MVKATHAKFSHIPYLQYHPLYKNLAAKFTTILDSFLLGVDCIRQLLTWQVVILGKSVGMRPFGSLNWLKIKGKLQ